jgi:hypothetical protein
MSRTPGQESTPVVVMTGTREHRAFLTCDGHAFTVPKAAGPYIVRAINSHASLLHAIEKAAPILDSFLNGQSDVSDGAIEAALRACQTALRRAAGRIE